MRLCKNLVAICLVFMFVAYSAGEDMRRDGNWWITESRSTKINYVLGFLDGMELGKNFSMWKYMHADDSAHKACISNVSESYGEFMTRYLDNVTVGQIVDGLEAFYSDYRNRRIETHFAVWYVVRAVAGTPENELKTLLENLRKNP